MEVAAEGGLTFGYLLHHGKFMAEVVLVCHFLVGEKLHHIAMVFFFLQFKFILCIVNTVFSINISINPFRPLANT